MKEIIQILEVEKNKYKKRIEFIDTTIENLKKGFAEILTIDDTPAHVNELEKVGDFLSSQPKIEYKEKPIPPPPPHRTISKNKPGKNAITADFNAVYFAKGAANIMRMRDGDSYKVIIKNNNVFLKYDARSEHKIFYRKNNSMYTIYSRVFSDAIRNGSMHEKLKYRVGPEQDGMFKLEKVNY